MSQKWGKKASEREKNKKQQNKVKTNIKRHKNTSPPKKKQG